MKINQIESTTIGATIGALAEILQDYNHPKFDAALQMVEDWGDDITSVDTEIIFQNSELFA